MTGAPSAVAGVVVFYNPDAGIEENILSYLPDLGLLTVVDNSPERPSARLLEFLASLGNVVYRWDGVNRGIATALNIGAEEALRRGFRRLLTMDQDSRFEPGALRALIAAAEPLWSQGAGLVSPWHALEGKDPEYGSGVEFVSEALTSGNLLDLEAYRAAGPFLDKLFIDYVDFEFCQRLLKRGYRIAVVRDARLVHPVGARTQVRVLGLAFHPTHHPPVRHYYMMRNRFYIWTRFPLFFLRTAHSTAITLTRTFLFESRRAEKLKMLLRGTFDFLRGRFGPYEAGRRAGPWNPGLPPVLLEPKPDPGAGSSK
jgi:rhamnosyltransferase